MSRIGSRRGRTGPRVFSGSWPVQGHDGQQSRPDQERRPTARQAGRIAYGTRELVPSSTTKDLSSCDRSLWDPRGKRRNGLPRHGAHPPRPECHILPWEGRLAARLVPASMTRGLSCKPAVWSRMPVLPSITPPDSRHASRPRTRHHPQRLPVTRKFARRGHSDHGVNGRLRQLSPSPCVNLSLPFRVSTSSNCPPQYCAVSQGNWLVNSVKPPSPCATQ